jgi:nucleolar pre-ribosomal-associated protein 1
MPLLTSVLNETPSLDDAYYQEVEWMLTYLSSALRTPADMAIFHKRHVFEKLLSLYGNVYVVRRLKDMILRILVLATAVEGGSTTLVTRFSILSWLGAEIGGESDEGRKKLLKGLLDKILQTCDKDKVEKWSGMKERI